MHRKFEHHMLCKIAHGWQGHARSQSAK